MSAEIITFPIIPRLRPIEVAPHPLNERLWDLIGKETIEGLTSEETAELNAIFAEMEGSAA